ncbi:MmcB family DNA repair protein [Pseudochrobactrum sp. MP213Fo]|uniref:MmcB family DNA repair protein n=1 Tax=Pseudochrobactrum sp. MP213Fo TaxID=3022250 RepID=UPI003BA35C6A
MPIISPFQQNPLIDGRQSDYALLVRRGVQRLCLDLNVTVLPEVSLRSGRRADLIGITRKGEIWIIEIKSSVEDWKADQKWPDYRAFCDRLFFATHPQVPSEIFPQDCGFILSDGYGAEILRDAPEHKLAPATRKALTLQIARIGANRLMLAELSGVEVSGHNTLPTGD